VSVLFKPIGTLDVSSADTDLPESRSSLLTGQRETDVASDALTRGLNVSTDRYGFAETRPGSSTVGTATGEELTHLTVQAGVRYGFGLTEIYRNESSILAGLTSGEWDSIQYNQFNDTDQQVFACNGTERKRINGSDVFEWGIAAPTVAPTIQVGASTGLTGDYLVKYTYVRKVGTTVVSESNPSPAAAAAVTLSNESLDITWTASSDPQVTHVRVYRTLANDGNYYVDQDIAVGTTTVDTTTTDAALGALVATDHDRPPAGTIVAGPVYDGYVFMVKDNLLYWCKPKQVEYWPADNFVEVSEIQEPIKALSVHDGQLYLATENRLYWVQGILSTAFNATLIESKAGAPNRYCLTGIKGAGLFHVGHDGLYLYANGIDKKITELNFEPLFRGEDTNGLQFVRKDAGRWTFKYENRFYFHYGNGNCLVLNTDQAKWVAYKWDRKMIAPAYDTTNKRFLAGTSGKTIRKLEDRDATDDAGTEIAWEVQSKSFTLQTRRHFPRWIKYDVTGTATGSLLLDGSAHQTHSLSTSRKTNRRLVKTGNGRRAQVKVTGTGSATIYAIEME
jgi:hypothetical protein